MSKELLTGPKARQMLDPRNGGNSQLENEKWKVFVLLEQKKHGVVLKKGSEVLHQVSYTKLELSVRLSVRYGRSAETI